MTAIYMFTMIKNVRVRYRSIYTAPIVNWPHVPSKPILSSGISQSDVSSHEIASKTSDHPAEVLI